MRILGFCAWLSILGPAGCVAPKDAPGKSEGPSPDATPPLMTGLPPNPGRDGSAGDAGLFSPAQDAGHGNDDTPPAADAGHDVAITADAVAGEAAAASDGAAAGEGPPLACNRGDTVCLSGCADLMIDARNCGKCENACLTGRFCGDGQCVLACGDGQTRCGQSCVRLESNTRNCGQCGVACNGAESCVQSKCTALSPSQALP